MKRTPLSRGRRPDRTGEPGWREWHEPVFGRCAVCRKPGLLLRHHVVLEQHVRVDGGDPWDLRNSLLIGYRNCKCHRIHHSVTERISLAKISDAAIAFCSELYGPGAGDYLSRYYAP